MKLFRKPVPPPPRQVVRSARPQAFSYHANRTEQEYNVGRAQPREQDVRRREILIRFWRQRLSVLLLGLLILTCVVYTLHLSSTPQIVPLTTSSRDYFLQPTSVYAHAASQLLKDSVLNGNKITIDTNRLSARMRQQFPELSAVSVALPLMGHRPVVYISPTAPSLILEGKNGSYVLDSNGSALIATDQISDVSNLHLPTVVDQSHLRLHVKANVLPATSVNFIRYVVTELQAKGISISQLSLPAEAYELDVTPRGEGYYVKFNLHDYQHAAEQVGTMLATQSRLKQQAIQPVHYIDVRLVGRAYYQ